MRARFFDVLMFCIVFEHQNAVYDLIRTEGEKR